MERIEKKDLTLEDFDFLDWYKKKYKKNKILSRKAQALGDLIISVCRAGRAAEEFTPIKLRSMTAMELVETLGMNSITFSWKVGSLDKFLYNKKLYGKLNKKEEKEIKQILNERE